MLICQKIELYGSLTTKELKKYSSRLVGRRRWRRWAARTERIRVSKVEVGGLGSRTVAGGPMFACR